MEERIARLLSIIFHPLFIPFYMLVILLNVNVFFAMMIPVKIKLILSGLVFLMTIIFPLLFVFLLYKLKLVKSFYLESREERIYPLLILAIFYYFTYYILKNFPISFIFSYYMLGSTFLTILALIISFYRKISLHMIGIGGMLGLLMGLSMNLGLDMTWFVIAAIILGGFLGFARIQSNSHKPSDIYAGFLVGASVMFLLFIFL
jgi:membrane-associated phospholipid phosphatase